MRKNGCKGKVRHRTREGAIIATKRQKNKQLGTYRCKVCSGWHVGNSIDPWKVQQRIDQLLNR